MGLVSAIISLLIVGLVVGALGRLVVPGRNPIGLGATVVVGVIGSLAGAVIGGLFGLGLLTIIVEVAISALLVAAVSSRQRNLPRGVS
jgi:uncharacterized membrane protein YeaQ/YmgE (transglycosylase-associated protein family)